jgi:methylated-DNA-[protein]-cysteine S-methyltransferase
MLDKNTYKTINISSFTSVLGEIIIASIDNKLCFLSFEGVEKSNKILADLTKNKQIIYKENDCLTQTKKQVLKYLSGNRKHFTIDILTFGTDFQKQVWQTLLKIPYGTTISYKTEAENIHKPKAFRAVANANGKNKIAIIIPCHRVVASGGGLGGYSSGLERKQFLLDLEGG